MTALNRMGSSGRILFLLLLAIAFLFASCTPGGAEERAPATAPFPSPETTAATPTATEPEVDAASLVDAWVRERNRFDESVGIEIEEETSVVALPGLRVYRATPLIPDMLDAHCAVYDEMVWCFQEALKNIVRRFSLGSDPGQLTDEEWLALATFFTGTLPLAGPDDLDRIDKYIPDDERAKINPPALTQVEDGGLQITFFYEEVDRAGYPDGPMALWKKQVVITGDNTVTFEDTEVWLSP